MENQMLVGKVLENDSLTYEVLELLMYLKCFLYVN